MPPASLHAGSYKFVRSLAVTYKYSTSQTRYLVSCCSVKSEVSAFIERHSLYSLCFVAAVYMSWCTCCGSTVELGRSVSLCDAQPTGDVDSFLLSCLLVTCVHVFFRYMRLCACLPMCILVNMGASSVRHPSVRVQGVSSVHHLRACCADVCVLLWCTICPCVYTHACVRACGARLTSRFGYLSFVRPEFSCSAFCRPYI